MVGRTRASGSVPLNWWRVAPIVRILAGRVGRVIQTMRLRGPVIHAFTQPASTKARDCLGQYAQWTAGGINTAR